MVEIQQSKDTCIDHLTVTSGRELEIMANLQSVSQIGAIIEGHVCEYLGSGYGWNKYESLMRSTVGYKARGRDDLAGIGKTPDTVPGFQQRQDL